jgi:Fur family iron response transcriptional regulator
MWRQNPCTARARWPVSLATVYNTLNQFTAAGLLKEVAVDSGRSLFDTNTAPHHHFFYPETGTLHDFPADSVVVTGLPRPPHGRQVAAVEIVVRLAAASGATSGVTARRGEAKAGRRKDF